MPDSMRAGDDATIAAITTGRDAQLELALAMEGCAPPCVGASEDMIASILPEHLRSAAARLDQLIDYLS